VCVRLERWAIKAAGVVTWPDMPAGVQDRAADVWEPLIAVADAAGGAWPSRARAAAVALVAAAKEDVPSLGVRLLADLRVIFDKRDAMRTTDILSALHALEEAPWSDLKGKPLNPRGLATRLRQYGITRKKVRFGSETTWGYARADLVDAWTRYLSPAPPESGTSGTEAPEPKAGADFSVPDDVPDTPGVPDHASQSGTLEASNSAIVPDVPDSGLAQEADCVGACNHCNKPILWDTGYTATSKGEVLHNGCVGAWAQE
jgi:Protein of unknown function (DUF3631)